MGPIWDAELRVWDAKNFGLVSPGTHRNKFVKKSLFIWFHTVFERLICLRTERYKLIFFLFYGQVHFGFLLAPGQVENFTISTSLGTVDSIHWGYCELD